MTTRNRTIVRTPRKDKSWAYTRAGSFALATNNKEVVADLLGDYNSALGLDESRKLTAMRIVGHLDLGNGSAASSATAHELFWGITWVSGSIAVLGAGGATIPDPGALGLSEASWLQCGSLGWRSIAGNIYRGADEGAVRASVDLDIKQMRKQPNAGDKLVLITRSTASSSEDAALWYDFRVMLALP